MDIISLGMNKNNIKAEVSDTWLRAFVAATRSGSFSAAAHALGVGQSAVTHSVARLENALGIRLFIRTPSGIVPTAAGANLFERISQLFVDIDRAVELARPNQGDPTVTLSVSTSLATYWLMPRLVEYKREHPHVHLRVITRDTDTSIGNDDADLWIPLGNVDRPDLVSTRFCDEEIVAVASPAVAQPIIENGIKSMATANLVNLEQRFSARFSWQMWFDNHEIVSSDPNMVYQSNDYSLVLQAAVDGEGIALGWTHLVADLLAEGKLMRIGGTIRTQNPFQVMYRKGLALNDSVASVLEWITKEGHRTLGD